jgi:CheY-like chemotaxis protein
VLNVLVVDDSAQDRRIAGSLLKKRSGVEPRYASNGREALEAIERERPAVVVTDLNMPEMDGLELVEAVRARWPELPVILMTAHGSEEIAVKALQKGAASYVPKRNLASELVDVLTSILEVARTGADQRRVIDSLAKTESHFVLDNDPGALTALIGHLEAGVQQMGLVDATGAIQVGVALREALVNAMFHGNLEVTSDLLESPGRAFHDLAEKRRHQAPFRERRVRLQVTLTRDEVRYVVTDEGRGFDPSSLPDPMDPENLDKPSGRGLLLIRTFMDDVQHNTRGNEITMIKRRSTGGEEDLTGLG